MHIDFKGTKYPVPDGSTAQEAFDSLKTLVIEMQNAKLEKDGDNFKAVVEYGKKG